ncbi:DUF6973 domain-containing protein [Rhodococcus aetherivorans]|uniref:DUF6973 domain-containing protein n=1 Tax=Rhodococcus aetherivorans TaxID=191292 RepID=UPI00374F81E8
MRVNRLRVMGVGAVLAAGIALGGTQGIGTANADVLSDLADAADCTYLYGSNCVHVEDARNWATEVTIWRFGYNGRNDISDAFRHCAWIGAVATRLGERDAYTVGFIHENNSQGPDSEFKMDDWNNFTGAQIGAAAVRSGTSDQWGYVLQKCEAKARSNQLYGLNGVKGNY